MLIIAASPVQSQNKSNTSVSRVKEEKLFVIEALRYEITISNYNIKLLYQIVSKHRSSYDFVLAKERTGKYAPYK